MAREALRRMGESRHPGREPMKRPSIESQLFEALAFAAYKHRNQRRKDVEASPYINHPIAWAQVVSGESKLGDQDVLIAAVLHDTLEDTKNTVAELRNKFGKRIASIVMEVTDNKRLRKSV